MATKEGTRYIEAIGRRKSATARVRITESDKQDIVVNEKPANEYFPTAVMQKTIREPLEETDLGGKFMITVKVSGSGLSGQSEAVRHGVSRALLKFNEELKPSLKKAGYLKRDPRSKERKKPGLRKARKRPQWSKR